MFSGSLALVHAELTATRIQVAVLQPDFHFEVVTGICVSQSFFCSPGFAQGNHKMALMEHEWQNAQPCYVVLEFLALAHIAGGTSGNLETPSSKVWMLAAFRCMFCHGSSRCPIRLKILAMVKRWGPSF